MGIAKKQVPYDAIIPPDVKGNFQDLKVSLQTEGLKDPLALRAAGEKFSIINGKKRWVCIGELIRENAMCYNIATSRFEPSSVVFETINATVFG